MLRKFPGRIATEVAEALGIAPIWHIWQVPGEKLKRGKFPADIYDAYVSREQGLLVQTRNNKGKAEIFSHLDWSPLYKIDAQTFATDDRHLSIRFADPSCQTLMLAMKAENVFTSMQGVAPPRSTKPKFAPRGRYLCAPIASTAEIVQHEGVYEIYFTGIFGTGIRYPLTLLNETTAYFDLARGVDESPPGRALVIYDAKEQLLEVSCMLARRVVFRAVTRAA